MVLTLNFGNILDLYGLSSGSFFTTTPVSIAQNVSIFINSCDIDHDGNLDLEDYEALLEYVGFAESTARNFFNAKDTDNDGSITAAELQAIFQSFDTDSNGVLDFSETLKFHNTFSSIDLDESLTFDSYDNLRDYAETNVKEYDFLTQDNATSVSELSAMFESWGINDGGSTASRVVNIYDSNNDNLITVEEYLNKYLEWDVAGDNDGSVDFYEGEGSEYMNALPAIFQIPDNNLESMAQQFILSIDGYQDNKLQEEELIAFFNQAYGLPESMAVEFINNFSGGDGYVSFTELVNTYKSFDANNDNELSYEETIAFQNTYAPIEIDTDLVTETQYAGLFNTAAQIIRSMDEDLNGELTVEEYSAVLKGMYEGSGIEPPMHAAENFIRIFDMDKNGTVNILEAIYKYSEYDANKDGNLSLTESSDLQAKLEKETLWETVNTEIIDIADKDNNAKLTLEEFTYYLKEKNMPEYIADDAITMFDMDLDEQLSRLELMEAFSRYDGTAENVAYIEEQTGEDYLLYTGDGDSRLDVDEKLKLYEDLASADYGVAYNPDHALVNQYEPIIADVEEFVGHVDFDNNGVISTAEYQVYLKELGLPNYFADNAVNNSMVNYDLNNDDNLDLIEWIQVNLDQDLNANGQLDVNELLDIYGDLSGIAIDADETNVDQYTRLFDKAKEDIASYDLNSDRILTVNELENYLDQYELPAVLAADMLNTYNNGINADGGLDALEMLKIYADYDVNENGILEFEEEFAIYDNMSAVDLGINADNANQYSKINQAVGDLVNAYDLNKNQKLDFDEIKAYFKAEGMSEDSVAQALAAYDINGPDVSLDILEWMKMYYDFDANKDGIMQDLENLAMFDYLANTGLNPDEFNAMQLLNIEDAVDSEIKNYDVDADKKFNETELQQIMNNVNLPDYVAAEFISKYDQDSDNKLDKLEYISAMVGFDHDSNGALEFNEYIEMFSEISGVDMNPTSEELDQYSKLYSQALNILKVYDDIEDKILNEEELAEYFNVINMPANMASKAIASYDLNGDNGIDLHELMKLNASFDDDEDGLIDFDEQIERNAAIAGISIDPAATTPEQVGALYRFALSVLKSTDMDADKMFSAEELAVYYSQHGLSENIARDVVNATDLDGNQSVDILEYMKTCLDFDTNKNGVLDFSEAINLYENATGIALGATEANTTQYLGLFKYANDYINRADTSDDKKISEEEYAIFMEANEMPANIADDLMYAYDINNDGGIDRLEFMSALIDLDVNKNGAFDFNEAIEYYDNALSNIDVSAESSNIEQYLGLFKYANDYINRSDTSGDNKISQEEYEAFMEANSMPANIAADLMNTYDTNRDGGIDNLEFMDALIDLDVNKNGAFDFNEAIEYYDNALPNIEMSAESSNLEQYSALFKYANDYINRADSSNDNKISQEEYATFMEANGMSANIADDLMNAYDANRDGGIDNLEFMSALIELDVNKNGLFDFNEAIEYYDNALSNIEINAESSNLIQYQSLFKYANEYIGRADVSNDNKISQEEYAAFMEANGISADIANDLMNAYDTNRDGGVDNLEFMSALIDLDVNKNGAFDFNEAIEYYDNALSGLEFDADASNTLGLFNQAMSFIKTADRDLNNEVSLDEYRVYLRSVGYPEYLADKLINQYDVDGDNSIDTLEQLRVYLNFDADESGLVSLSEGLNMWVSTANDPDLNLYTDFSNEKQVSALYKTAQGAIRTYDINNDNTLSATEYEAAFKAIGLPEYVAQGIVNYYDTNSDNVLDILEVTQYLVDIDKNNSGTFESVELMNYYENLAEAGTNITLNFNTTDDNIYQINSIFKTYTNFVKSADKNNDNIIQVNEYEDTLVAAGYLNADIMASNAVNIFDLNNDGGIDAFEWMKAIISFDDNSDGRLDAEEVADFVNRIS